MVEWQPCWLIDASGPNWVEQSIVPLSEFTVCIRSEPQAQARFFWWLGLWPYLNLKKYLQAYHMYRARALSTPEVLNFAAPSQHYAATGSEPQARSVQAGDPGTLQKEFLFGVQRVAGRARHPSPLLVHGEAAISELTGSENYLKMSKFYKLAHV
jgi:hypothetical protein